MPVNRYQDHRAEKVYCSHAQIHHTLYVSGGAVFTIDPIDATMNPQMQGPNCGLATLLNYFGILDYELTEMSLLYNENAVILILKCKG
jgi:hypothetical protein